MPTPIYHSGSDGRAFVTPLGSAPTQSELSVTGWDADIDGDLKTFDNNQYGRWKQGGNPDVSGTLKMHWDSANRPTATNSTGTSPGIRNGAFLALQLNEDGTTSVTNSWRFMAIIDHVKPSSEFAGTMDFECTYKLQSGAIKMPGDT